MNISRQLNSQENLRQRHVVDLTTDSEADLVDEEEDVASGDVVDDDVVGDDVVGDVVVGDDVVSDYVVSDDVVDNGIDDIDFFMFGQGTGTLSLTPPRLGFADLHEPKSQEDAFMAGHGDPIGGFGFNDDLENQEIAEAIRLSLRESELQPLISPPSAPTMEQVGRPKDLATTIAAAKIECIEQVAGILPDICRDYVSTLYETRTKSFDNLVAIILHEAETGKSYPKAKVTQKDLKRKRDKSDDEEAARIYAAAQPIVPSVDARFAKVHVLLYVAI